MKSKGYHYRFAVGSENSKRSNIWRLWTAKPPKSDVYLSARHIAGQLKVSLHESGLWQVAFSKEYSDINVPQLDCAFKSRHLDRWVRPNDIARGVTLGFKLYITSSELRKRPVRNINSKQVMWIPIPSYDAVIEIALIFSLDPAIKNEWPGKKAIGSRLLTHTLLSNGETLWAVYVVHQLTAQAKYNLENHRKILKDKFAKSPSLKKAASKASVSALIGGEEGDGSHYIVEIAADSVV